MLANDAVTGIGGSVKLNVANGVREARSCTPDKSAIIDNGRHLTFAALDDRSSRLANALLSHGIEPRGAVGVLMGNRAEFLEAVIAIAKAGMTFVPLNPRLSVSELDHVLDHADVTALVADTAYAEKFSDRVPQLRYTVVAGAPGERGEDGASYEEELDAASAIDPRVDVGDGDPFTIVYTSGTTGRPKGVVVSHRARVLGMLAAGLEWGLGPESTSVAVSPMPLGAGFTFAYTSVFLGGTTTILRHWDPQEFLATIRRDRATAAFLVPTHAQTLQAAAEPAGQPTADEPTLRTFYFNAAALPVVLKNWVLDRFPNVGVHELYGSTEAGVVTNLRPEHARSRAGSVGLPWFMTEVRLVDADGNLVERGEPGELYSRSPLAMSHYHKDPEATAACTTSDGFLTVGDLASQDNEGFISIVGRKKDMIITGGINVYPNEIEELLLTHESIAEVAVVGLPDQKWGEAVTAFVVARPRKTVNPEALAAFLQPRLADFKRPRDYRIVTSLPRNSNGKVVKRHLVEGETS